MTPSGSIPSGPPWSRSLELHFGKEEKKRGTQGGLSPTVNTAQRMQTM